MSSQNRHQIGRIYEASGKFYVQYRRSEIIDGVQQRVQRSEFRCSQDAKHKAATDKSVKVKRDEFMLQINLQSSSMHDVPIVEFWTGVCLPFAQRNLRASTVSSYRQIWNQHLERHFGKVTNLTRP